MKKGKVVKVLDGDTFEMDYEGINLRCRVTNVDSPELKRPFGKEAKDYLESLLLNKEVSFEVEKKDAFGRYVVNLQMESEKLDEHLIRLGMCWHWHKQSNNAKLLELEQLARHQKLGLWQDKYIDLHYCEKCKSLQKLTSE